MRNNVENGQGNTGNPIAPRLKIGEIPPATVEGMVPTRVDGGIILVPARTADDKNYGKSPYTIRQLKVIDATRLEKARLANETLFNAFFPGETPDANLAEMVIDFTGPLGDHLDL